MINTSEGKTGSLAGERASIWDGSPLKDGKQTTMTTAECAHLELREGIPWLIWAFHLSWKGPFDVRNKFHWRILWHLDIFLGPVPFVKTLIALNILVWIILCLAR